MDGAQARGTRRAPAVGLEDCVNRGSASVQKKQKMWRVGLQAYVPVHPDRTPEEMFVERYTEVVVVMMMTMIERLY